MAWLRALALLTFTVSIVFGEPAFYLKDGDRVVFYGDSITDQRLYTVFTETYAVTRFPKEHFTFYHSGWGGDRVGGGGGGPIDVRLRRDVLAYKPTVMTIMLGMNDAGYKPFDPATLDVYSRGYEHILDVVQGAFPKIRITAIMPSPYDDVTKPPTFEGGYNEVLGYYSKFVKRLAGSIGIDTADLNTSVVAALKRAYETDPALAQQLIPDRVHPGPAGHMLMAEALLKAWRAPAMVSDVELNAKTRKVEHATDATVTDFDGSKWKESENSLPMPIDWKDPVTAFAMRSSNFVEALDREMLRVTGLRAGKWVLKIDGAAVSSFTGEELGKGVNLAQFETPMMQQAGRVHELTRKHSDVHNLRWRQVQVPLAGDKLEGMDAALKALDELEAGLVKEQHEAAQPAEHEFEIVPQS